MYYQDEKVSAKIVSTLAKLNQLLRLFEMSKKVDTSNRTIVENQVRVLLESIQDEPLYSRIQYAVEKQVAESLAEVKSASPAPLNRPKIATKIEQRPSMSSFSSNSNMSSIKNISSISKQQTEIKVINNLSSPFSSNEVSIDTKVINGKVGSSNNLVTISNNNKNIKSVINQTEEKKKISFSTEKKMNSIVLNAEETSNEKSEDNNYEQLASDLSSFCTNCRDTIEEKMEINPDILSNLKKEDEEKYVYLFGINSLEKKREKPIYVCTVMKFFISELIENNYSGENTHDKELRIIQNNLRYPMGLFIAGSSIDSIKIEYLAFLIKMKSSFPMIICMDSFNPESKGKIFKFSEYFIQSITTANKAQFNERETYMRDTFRNAFVPLDKIQIAKEKMVVTKFFSSQNSQKISSSIEPAENAIQIETENSCIKEEMNYFPYKLHTKFYVTAKSDYQIFYLNNNNVVSFKMNFKEKEFEQFNNFVLEEAKNKSKNNFILSTSLLKETSEIKKDFFRLLVACKARDSNFFVNLSGISNKKTLILTLKEEVTEEFIYEYPNKIELKDLEKETSFTRIISIINKQNYKTFESETKVDVIDLTAKKK